LSLVQHQTSIFINKNIKASPPHKYDLSSSSLLSLFYYFFSFYLVLLVDEVLDVGVEISDSVIFLSSVFSVGATNDELGLVLLSIDAV